ncbi:hypothetical protein GGI17_004172 [Coemansia sp. S146]|nr:hypothetical protein GGI17_004172 [Coemansia sp. S146]
MDDATAPLESLGLSEQLESLGSALKTHIISDMNAWEDRRRSEALSVSSGGGGRGRKSGHNKRARLQAPSDSYSEALPDPPESTLLGIRRIRHMLYDSSEAVGAVSIWAIGILALSVSLADMKDEFRLGDLMELPATKEAFQLLEIAVESEFVRGSVEAAETALIDRVLRATNDSRAVGWILSQYGAVHSATFPRCLQLYAIAKMALPSGLEATGLAQAVSDLNSAHPEHTAKALEGILGIYRDTVARVSDDVNGLQDIPADDLRRFILFYILQAARHSRGPQVLSGNSMGGSDWLADAIKFEMRTGFSQFHVCSEELAVLRPLATAIEVLYVDMMAGRPKKLSDQPLDIERVMSTFTLIGGVVRGLTAEQNLPKSESGDIIRDVDDGAIVSFIDSCHACLVRLIAREQEIIILNQMPKTVKNMLQPIPNGLHEAAQKGARIYNNGPISMPTIGDAEVEGMCEMLFDVLASNGGGVRPNTTAAANRLYEMACDTAPMLVEILVSRMADALDMVKRLVRRLVEHWPLRNSEGAIEMCSVRALYRALLAISEASRGLLLHQLREVFESALSRHRRQLLFSRLEQMVDLLAAAVSHQYMLAKCPAQVGSLLGLREVIGDLCGVLVVCWPRLWFYCFGSSVIGNVSRLRVTLVKVMVTCLALPVVAPMRTVDCLTLAEHAMKELIRTQNAIADPERAQADSSLLELASALLALIFALAKQPGVGRVAIEKLLRVILLPTPPSQPNRAKAAVQLDVVFEISDEENVDSGNTRQATKRRLRGSDDSAIGLEQLLDGAVLPRIGDRKGAAASQETLAKAEHMLWQNAVRPMPKYPRSGMHSHDRTKDAWSFVRTSSSKPNGSLESTRPLLVFGLLSLAHTAPSGVTMLCELLEEYYIDCLPSMPPHLLDERLNSSGGARLQLRAIEMELVQDIRENADLEHILLEVIRSGSAGAAAAKRLVSALVVALVVLWNGALGESTMRRERDLAFTTRLVAHIIEAYGNGDRRSAKLCELFSLISGGDLARLLHQYVWRWIIHRMPSAEDESQQLLRHILRRYVVKAAPLFKYLVTTN